MNARRTAPARAWVLHRRPYRDTSLLVETLVEGHGRLGLVARGARGQRGRTAAHLEPFQPLLITWSGRGELFTLGQVESAGRGASPVGRALMAAYYCNELLLRLLRRDQDEPGVFAAYERVMGALAGDAEPSVPLRHFELALLDALGYAPPLDRDAETGEPLLAGCEYDFLPEQGPVRASGPPRTDAVRVPGAHLLALAAGQLDDEAVLRSARALLRASLAPHLGGRPLKTREMYRQLYGRGG